MVANEPSQFSAASGVSLLERLLASAEHFPTWVLSYGNAEIGLQKLVEIVERFRPVTVAEEFRYAHLTGLSSDEHKDRNKELLLVAGRQM